MAKKRQPKTIRKDILDTLSEEKFITPTVVNELLGIDLKQYVEQMDVEEDDVDEYVSIIEEMVVNAFLCKAKDLEAVTVCYEELVDVITNTKEGESYSFKCGEHIIKGEGGDEDLLFESDIELDGKSIVAELIDDGAVDIIAEANEDMIEYACMSGFSPDEVASFFGATLKLKFEGEENYAKYF